jgi:hypothetical protein
MFRPRGYSGKLRTKPVRKRRYMLIDAPHLGAHMGKGLHSPYDPTMNEPKSSSGTPWKWAWNSFGESVALLQRRLGFGPALRFLKNVLGFTGLQPRTIAGPCSF